MEEFPTRGQEILTELTSTRTEWESLWKRLRFYTNKNFRSKIKDRLYLDTVIQDAIDDVYFGNRHLQPDSDLFLLLCGTIRSNISHILEKEKRNTSIEEAEATSQRIHLTKPFGAAKENPHLAEQGAEGYQGLVYKELCGQILKAARSNTLLLQLVELLFITPDLKPGEIALQMNQPIERVNNLLRQLRRRLRKPKRG